MLGINQLLCKFIITDFFWFILKIFSILLVIIFCDKKKSSFAFVLTSTLLMSQVSSDYFWFYSAGKQHQQHSKFKFDQKTVNKKRFQSVSIAKSNFTYLKNSFKIISIDNWVDDFKATVGFLEIMFLRLADLLKVANLHLLCW